LTQKDFSKTLSLNFFDHGFTSGNSRLIKVEMPTVPLDLDEDEIFKEPSADIFGEYYSRQLTHATRSSFLSINESSSDTEVEVFSEKNGNLPEINQKTRLFRFDF
jgi:hypothetical protein